ncbi:hypothetical protein B0H12DRAFT_1075929 [Mycena haematopus]|nr:hypothetical protein B0H12DRAFT_1075929 [Mycena haematopus]
MRRTHRGEWGCEARSRTSGCNGRNSCAHRTKQRRHHKWKGAKCAGGHRHDGALLGRISVSGASRSSSARGCSDAGSPCDGVFWHEEEAYPDTICTADEAAEGSALRWGGLCVARAVMGETPQLARSKDSFVPTPPGDETLWRAFDSPVLLHLHRTLKTAILGTHPVCEPASHRTSSSATAFLVAPFDAGRRERSQGAESGCGSRTRTGIRDGVGMWMRRGGAWVRLQAQMQPLGAARGARAFACMQVASEATIRCCSSSCGVPPSVYSHSILSFYVLQHLQSTVLGCQAAVPTSPPQPYLPSSIFRFRYLASRPIVRPLDSPPVVYGRTRPAATREAQRASVAPGREHHCLPPASILRSVTGLYPEQ